MEAKRARHAIVQIMCWGVFLSVVGGAIAIGTRPHVGVDGLYSGDETGFWFGVIVFWLGAMLLVVPLVAWGVRLGRDAWPSQQSGEQPRDEQGHARVAAAEGVPTP